MIVISVHIWMAIIDMRGFFMVVSHVPYYQKNEGKLNEWWFVRNMKKQANKLFGCCPACVAYLEYAQPCVGLNHENGVSFYQWGEFASFRVGFLEKVVVNFVPDAQLQRHRERCWARRWLSAQLCGRHCWVALQFKGGHLRQDYEKKDHRVWVVLGKGLDRSIKLWTFGIGGVFPFYKFNEKLPIEGQNNQSYYVQNTSLLYRDGAGWGGGC